MGLMYTFALLLLPFLAATFSLSDKKALATFIIGVFVGTVLCAALAVLFFSHRVVEASFFQNFLFYARTQYSLPLFSLYIVYKLASHKRAHKEYAFYTTYRFSFMLGAFSIFMPWTIIREAGANLSIFELFIKPLLYFSMLTVFCAKIHQSFRLRTPLAIVASVISLVVPPAINTLWLLTTDIFLVYIISAIFVAYGVILFLRHFLLEKDDSPNQ